MRLAVALKPFSPLRCCYTIDLEIPKEVVRSRKLSVYAKLLVEYETPLQPYCYVPTRRTFMPMGNRSPGLATYPECQARTCRACNIAAHTGPCACRPAARRELEAEGQLLKFAKSKDWRRCPRCCEVVKHIM
ncbi:hypothetical protein QBC33DRAFT_555447 [Phialemonium atrogriseum]|uniref:IBR domain-containing protein n=1 Tax=Phialemonium atrogriseum TaxID=1093897 RepID=A0AAJ0C6A1_9PEZI|nr:uncharacterized protein QBC33DRAFT_555447 [Phialemonium atrogriseum]KAK1770949.1 hypothetical protein QBC33DRAFT_555447 [Phialemonium atrogriseum]